MWINIEVINNHMSLLYNSLEAKTSSFMEHEFLFHHFLSTGSTANTVVTASGSLKGFPLEEFELSLPFFAAFFEELLIKVDVLGVAPSQDSSGK